MTAPHIPPTRKPQNPERHALCTRRCRSCIHGFDFGEGAGCEYILNTAHRRPCPAGIGCTEFKRGKKLQQKNVAALISKDCSKAAEAEKRRREWRSRRREEKND